MSMRTRQDIDPGELADELLANVSHELRTPLTPILGYAHLLRRQQIEGADAMAALDDIVKSSARLEQTIDTLMTAATFRAGAFRQQASSVDVAAIARDVVVARATGAPAHHLRLVPDGNLPAIAADRSLVERAVTELVDNAVKFAPSGGCVTVRVTREGKHLRVDVADDGVGIAEETLGRLGQDFVQGDASPTRRYEGLGLGLSIAARVARAHDGRLCLASTVGKGTTATLLLPIAGPKRPRPRRRGAIVALAATVVAMGASAALAAHDSAVVPTATSTTRSPVVRSGIAPPAGTTGEPAAAASTGSGSVERIYVPVIVHVHDVVTPDAPPSNECRPSCSDPSVTPALPGTPAVPPVPPAPRPPAPSKKPGLFAMVLWLPGRLLATV
jgi:hypothetical protein